MREIEFAGSSQNLSDFGIIVALLAFSISSQMKYKRKIRVILSLSWSLPLLQIIPFAMVANIGNK